jgi:hypothetical protein
MFELRKQPEGDTSGKKIEIIEKTPFKAQRWDLIKKAKQLQKEEPKFYFWVFENIRKEK